jgi:hypothetical protein
VSLFRKKVGLTLSSEALEAVEYYCLCHGVDLKEAVRRAIAVQHYLDTHPLAAVYEDGYRVTFFGEEG